MSRYLIIASVLFWSIYNVHALIGYETNRFGCYPPSGTTYSFFASVDAIVTTLIPSVSRSSWFGILLMRILQLIMIIFSLLAL